MPAHPDREEGTRFDPRFGPDGLVTAIVADESGTVLMVAMMNAEAIERTVETGEAWFWSRSRAELWHKGATSGNVLRVSEIRVDCDQDALWLTAEPQPGKDGGNGVACHTGRRSCFYRRVEADGTLSFL